MIRLQAIQAIEGKGPAEIIAIARAHVHSDEAVTVCHAELKRQWPEWAGGTPAAFGAKLRAAVRSATPEGPLVLVQVQATDMHEGTSHLLAAIGDTTGVYHVVNGRPHIERLAGFTHFFRIERTTAR